MKLDGQMDLFSMLDEANQDDAVTGQEKAPEQPSPIINLFDFFGAAPAGIGDISAPDPQPEKIDYHITADEPGAGNAISKYRHNVDAIRLLKKIEAESRLATAEEQETLSNYVGWGSLPMAFDAKDEEWREAFQELKELLSDEEYRLARESILSAYYTPPVVIRSVYQALENFGFKKGNILEPSCGTGHFFGLLPESMKDSRLYGVEIDSLTGRIARQLYQTANITIQGFESAWYPDNFFDVICGNVPFGSYKVLERRYDKYGFMIHDFFLAKALDMVRPGGIVALITHKGTLDKENKSIRGYLSARADLIGAIRLPNNAFASTAGTTVTADILFFQKKERMGDVEAKWLELETVGNGIPVNAYFASHPEMMLGHMEFDTRYGEKSETKLLPFKEVSLADQLSSAVSNLAAKITERSWQEEDTAEKDLLPADPAVKNFSYTIVDGKLYYRENSVMVLQKRSSLINRRIRGMIKLREAVREVIHTQMLDICSDEIITSARVHLNEEYGRFVTQFGIINSKANRLAFRHEADYPLLSSLEILQEDGNVKKADIFYKRTIRQKRTIAHVDTSVEALAVCLNEIGHVDIAYMAGLTGKKPFEVIQELQGIIFQDPQKWEEDEYQGWEPGDQYLSGNVRQKLRDANTAAEKYSNRFDLNVQALENVQPVDIEAADIDLRLGAIWIDPKYITQFIFYLLKPSKAAQELINVEFSRYNCTWHIDGKSSDYGNVRAVETYGTTRIDAYEIIERTLNLQDVKIFDREKNAEGNEVYVINRAETIAAQERQGQIKDEFKQWVFTDPTRRNDLVRKYNEQFNSIRLREFSGDHLTFPGMSSDIELKPHQKDSVARILYGGNTLLAQEVGAGKTFEMAAAAMELRRLGIANKSLIIVPNYLVGEWGAEFLRLYPSANILLAETEDFEKSKRQRFCGKIATGDYDAVVMAHSSFEKIPISGQRAAAVIQKEIDEIQEAIDEAKAARGENYTIKQMLAAQKRLEARLQSLENRDQQDDVVDFEQLGVDFLFVDEADNFKNLFLHTKMRNVAGISQAEAKKSTDLYIKCQYLNELTDNHGIVFATGTPVSNSMTELYTLQRYLQPDELDRMGLEEFDCWASVFGECISSVELAPEGTGYRAKTRFAKFFNVPELMNMFKIIADIRTADMLQLPVPALKGGKVINVVSKPTNAQRDLVGQLGERAEHVRGGNVDPHEDNMLRITTDGRVIALDQRLYDPSLPDDPGSKVNTCILNLYDIWVKTRPERLTQLVFCDISTPKYNGSFNLYDDIKAKLMKMGVPEGEIAYIHDAKTGEQKSRLFARMRAGSVRILIGSTAKLGAGTNVQTKLVALHHIDVPWRPRDLSQREGRILRQGNMNAEVAIYRYVTEGTFDAYSYQLVEHKQKFISQIMTSKAIARSMEDIDEVALSYAEVKALATGNPRIKEKMELDVEVGKLQILKAQYNRQHYRIEDDIQLHFPKQIQKVSLEIKGFESDIGLRNANSGEIFSMTLNGTRYSEKVAAGQKVLEAAKRFRNPKEELPLGQYRGFDLLLQYHEFGNTHEMILRGAINHYVDVGESETGNITRLDNALDAFEKHLDYARSEKEKYQEQVRQLAEEVAKPFTYEKELETKSRRLAQINSELDLENQSVRVVMDEGLETA